MVRGASPGPAPAAQARASNGSWRTWSETAQERPQGRWRLEGCGLFRRCATRRRRQCSRRQPAQSTRVILSPVVCPGPDAGQPRPRCRANRISPALATRRWSSKAIWMRSGWSSGSIFWVLLVSGWFCLSKTIIPDAQEHFLTPSPRRNTHLFGGLGFSLVREAIAEEGRKQFRGRLRSEGVGD